MTISRALVGLLVWCIFARPASATSYSFTTIGQPGLGGFGINDSGQIVGIDFTGPAAKGYLYSDGVLTEFSAPRAIQTYASGINDLGQISGFYVDQNNMTHGFVNFAGRSVTTFNLSESEGQIGGINNSGDLVGYTIGNTGVGGFKYDVWTGLSTALPIELAFGINDFGSIVGSNSIDALLYSRGVLTEFNVPGALETEAYGINDAGVIVGDYFNTDTNATGFVYQNGNYTFLNVPGAFDTRAFGISNNGEIVGAYFTRTSGSVSEHTFVANVEIPEPKTDWVIALVCCAIIVIGPRRSSMRIVASRSSH
jgi:uncharacterized membrane protein